MTVLRLRHRQAKTFNEIHKLCRWCSNRFEHDRYASRNNGSGNSLYQRPARTQRVIMMAKTRVILKVRVPCGAI